MTTTRSHNRAGLAFGLALPVLLSGPGIASASIGESLTLPWWSAVPFVALLLAIAVLPLLKKRWWHRNRNKALVSIGLGGVVAAYLLSFGSDGAEVLLHILREYFSFIVLLGSLYTISGGILVEGDLRGRPLNNTFVLLIGASIASFVGTTGASMVLIRPFLRMNQGRKRVAHLPVFFIFIVSNLGGLLTPLGDPPLFLGYIKGVHFTWTLEHLWPQWLVANGIVLAVFLVWDTLAAWGDVPPPSAEPRPFRIRGAINFILLGGVVGATFSSRYLDAELARMRLVEALQIVLALLSLLLTPRTTRVANQFAWGPIVEVAVLFVGIFVAMLPALFLLREHGDELGVNEPWQYFWLSGGLSSFLDNAPTYVTFGTLAAGKDAADFAVLMNADKEALLAAISCGSVFMGANTYIGNGPNFMVQAIAEEAGYPTPSFFGYMVYSGLVLLPTFGLITFVFFV